MIDGLICSHCEAEWTYAEWERMRMSNTTKQAGRPELTFDGCGINGPDEYRTRIATFTSGAGKYGPLFAAAPALLNCLRHLEAELQAEFGEVPAGVDAWMAQARVAITQAEGGSNPGL